MNSVLDDTIFAPATVPGTGAICVIRISGLKAAELTDKIVRFKNGTASAAVGQSVKFGEIAGVDEVLVSIFRAPHSYTGEDCVEVSCHSSKFIVSKILSLLSEAGGRPANAGEFTMRAFLNGKMDLSQAEAVADVIAADSGASHRIALNQLKGGYSSELKGLRDDMVKIAALLELELDFSEEDVEFASRERIKSLLEAAASRVDSLSDGFARGSAIKNGIPVAIVGSPNSGKSTLLNALAKDDRAIVSDIPGTTRDTIEEIIEINGISFRIIDTAGIRKTDDIVENEGINRAFGAVSKALVVICLIDSTSMAEGLKTLEQVRAHASASQKIVPVISKADLLGVGICGSEGNDLAGDCRVDGRVAAGVGKAGGLVGAVSISAKTGFGMDELQNAMSKDFTESLDKDIIVTSARHFDALKSCSASLHSALDSLQAKLPGDLLAEDLRAAISSLNHIWGEDITSNEVLGAVFERFCIGK